MSYNSERCDHRISALFSRDAGADVTWATLSTHSSSLSNPYFCIVQASRSCPQYCFDFRVQGDFDLDSLTYFRLCVTSRYLDLRFNVSLSVGQSYVPNVNARIENTGIRPNALYSCLSSRVFSHTAALSVESLQSTPRVLPRHKTSH